MKVSNFLDYTSQGNFPFIISLPDNLNIRSSPRTDASITYRIPSGTILMYMGDAGYSNGYKWWKVKYFNFAKKAFYSGYAACQVAGGNGTFYLAVLGTVEAAGWLWTGVKLCFDKYSTPYYDSQSNLIGWTTVGRWYYAQSCWRLAWDSVSAYVRCFVCGSQYPERMAIASDIGYSSAWAYWGCNGNAPGDTGPEYPFSRIGFIPATNTTSCDDIPDYFHYPYIE